jgi:hypothetical protein
MALDLATHLEDCLAVDFGYMVALGMDQSVDQTAVAAQGILDNYPVGRFVVVAHYIQVNYKGLSHPAGSMALVAAVVVVALVDSMADWVLAVVEEVGGVVEEEGSLVVEAEDSSLEVEECLALVECKCRWVTFGEAALVVGIPQVGPHWSPMQVVVGMVQE